MSTHEPACGKFGLVPRLFVHGEPEYEASLQWSFQCLQLKGVVDVATR